MTSSYLFIRVRKRQRHWQCARGCRRLGEEKDMMSYEKLDVYKASIEYLATAIKILDDFPKRQTDLQSQLKRASISIPLNIAEGAGKWGQRDCAKYYGIARGSAMECGAALDVYGLLGIVKNEDKIKAKELIHRIVSMLTKMMKIR